LPHPEHVTTMRFGFALVGDHMSRLCLAPLLTTIDQVRPPDTTR
jgi:hypothetical protein